MNLFLIFIDDIFLFRISYNDCWLLLAGQQTQVSACKLRERSIVPQVHQLRHTYGTILLVDTTLFTEQKTLFDFNN